MSSPSDRTGFLLPTAFRRAIEYCPYVQGIRRPCGVKGQARRRRSHESSGRAPHSRIRNIAWAIPTSGSMGALRASCRPRPDQLHRTFASLVNAGSIPVGRRKPCEARPLRHPTRSWRIIRAGGRSFRFPKLGGFGMAPNLSRPMLVGTPRPDGSGRSDPPPYPGRTGVECGRRRQPGGQPAQQP